MRASNIELLRIVAIIFIMLEHIVVFALNPAGFDIPKPHYVIPDSVANACISVFIVGVDIFVLISGYFTIKLSILKISKLWFCCAFYELFNFLSAYLILGDISKTAALKFLLPLSNGWFMPTYIALMIISPFLNSCLNSISKKQYFYCLILFTWMNVYFGFIMNKVGNANGFSVINFIYLYILGRYVRRFPIKIGRITALFVFILSILSIYTLSMFRNGDFSFAYNNPLVLLSALALFILFEKQADMSSKSINYIATLSFPVFLSHSIVVELVNRYLSVHGFAVIVPIILVYLSFIVLLDIIRKYWQKKFSSFVSKYFNDDNYQF